MRFKCPHGWTIAQRIAHHSRPDPLSDCWIWQASTQRQGYGLVGYRNRVWLAHRLAWTDRHGPIPAGKILCHRCDERRCVNPDHLFLGDWRLNMADLKAKRLRRRTAADSGRMHIFIRGLELAGTVTWITPYKENDHEQIDRQAARAEDNQGRDQNPDAAPASGSVRTRTRSRAHP